MGHNNNCNSISDNCFRPALAQHNNLFVRPSDWLTDWRGWRLFTQGQPRKAKQKRCRLDFLQVPNSSERHNLGMMNIRPKPNFGSEQRLDCIPSSTGSACLSSVVVSSSSSSLSFPAAAAAGNCIARGSSARLVSGCWPRELQLTKSAIHLSCFGVCVCVRVRQWTDTLVGRSPTRADF